MKTKLILIILTLVILPTAILSLMAGRALRHRELVLEHQRQTAAVNTVQEVSIRVVARLEDDLELVNDALSQSLSRSTRFGDLETVAARLQDSSETVKQVFLFKNPWGFLYPEVRGQSLELREGGSNRLRPGWDFVPEQEQDWTDYDQLLAVLRQKVASVGTRTDTMWVTVKDATYCFSRLGDRRSLYAGYEVDLDGFSKQLSRILAGLSGGEFILQAGEPDVKQKDSVIVSDSFGLSGGLPSNVNHDNSRSPAPQRRRLATSDYLELASGTLAPPFDTITLKAFLRNPAEAMRVERFQERLYAWGILLLAAGICVGACLVIREAGAQIQTAKARSDFLVGVSHDLRTPVSSMKMLAESLYLDHVPDPQKQKKFHGTIVKECERLADIIERVLFFIRAEHKTVRYTFEEVDIGRFVGSVIQPFIERTAGRVKLDLKVATDLSPVSIDPDAMSKVLLNLLDNAVKYSHDLRSSEYGLPIVIVITVDAGSRRGRPWVGISVRDWGIGIEPSQQKKIFDEYYRAPVEATGGMAGIGLGLSLCKKIVKAHKGSIELESTPGKGSTFSIFLPAVGKE